MGKVTWNSTGTTSPEVFTYVSLGLGSNAVRMPLSCQHFHSPSSHIDFLSHTSLLKQSLSLQFCPNMQCQVFRASSPGDAWDCLAASAVYLVLAFGCQVPKGKF